MQNDLTKKREKITQTNWTLHILTYLRQFYKDKPAREDKAE